MKIHLLCLFLSSGHDEVMFIHTHYSHLIEIVSEAPEPPPSHQERGQRSAACSLLCIILYVLLTIVKSF